MQSILRPALVMFGALTLVCGVAYPVLVTSVAQAAFPDAANGSLLKQGDKVVGSRLIGQSFTAPQYFWGRPSATGPMPNNGGGSSGSNQGPLNPALGDALKGRAEALRAADPANAAPIPVDLVTASASGLDPEISLDGARWQAARVAKARGLATDDVQRLIDEHAEGRVLGLFGEPRVNVLALNLALDGQKRDTR
ncbi:potassium-transporting ATPase subunit KdpC [Massilia sp. G4R7]|uniref:Potassium-transporting ATPase KdpC subunit n=1 Tax=Massilia phyllostachyos TaxID=2898585 RepID=A0ABS8Q754_9BURK|nr:potassium-transporting ATPase subunit KdpC [Massilia phyllostachyos]MCD2517568.1 potassium-transporting ATPase subunit KdpC [Massilia phyllostachyos]